MERKASRIQRLLMPQWDQINLDRMKFQTKALALLTTVLLLVFIYISLETYYDQKGRILIEARESYDQRNPVDLKTYESFDFTGFSYTTGMEGTLYYRPKTPLEALLYNRIGSQTLIDFIVYAAICIFLFVRLRKVSDKNSFSTGILSLFYYIGFMLLMLPMLNYFFQTFVVSEMLEQSTGYRFEFVNEDSITRSHIPIIIMMILLYFLKKGVELQQEQDLTV